MITQTTMKKKLCFLTFFVLMFLFTSLNAVMADGPAPPPPNHAQNGNQASPGGTGCPIDRTQGIILATVLSLGYAGFVLFRKGQSARKKSSGA